MFYAIIPESPPVFIVQPDEENISIAQAAELIERLEAHFLHAISIVRWDHEGKFKSFGFQVSEQTAANEDLEWREFELPALPEIPF